MSEIYIYEIEFTDTNDDGTETVYTHMWLATSLTDAMNSALKARNDTYGTDFDLDQIASVRRLPTLVLCSSFALNWLNKNYGDKF